MTAFWPTHAPPGNDHSHVWAGASPTGIAVPPAGERSVGEAAYPFEMDDSRKSLAALN